jgi:phage terminase small subunit
MKDKLTPKQEKFCNLYVELGNASEAYRQSYNSLKMKNEVIAVKASELLSSGNISVRVKQLQSQHAKRNAITVDTLLAELEEHRKIAISAETPQIAAANASTLGKAKLLGLDKQIIDHTSSDGSMTPTIQVKFID